jgi:hypothetical protein
LDVDNIAPGLDFARVLNERVGECDVLLAVIGKSWIDTRDGAGKRRLEDPDDFVRIEIASALAQNKRVIPVLVGDAPMPRPDELPLALKPLARRNAVRLTHERFRSDVQGLIKALQNALAEIEEQQREQAKTEAERRADEARRLAEAEAARLEGEQRRRQQGEAEARQRAADERRRIEESEKERQVEEAARVEEQRRRIAQAAAARQAEEQAQAAAERARLERRAQEERAFSGAKRDNTLGTVEAFLAAYPDGQFAAEARSLKATLLARAEAHRHAMASENAAVLRSFLQTYTRGVDADQVRQRLRSLEPKRSGPLLGKAIAVSGALVVALIAAVVVFWARGEQPASGQHASTAPGVQTSPSEAQAPASAPQADLPKPAASPAPVPLATEQMAWDLVKGSKDPDQLRRFVSQFPDGAHRSEAEQLISTPLSAAQHPAAMVTPDPHELARSLQFELKRVGCFNGMVDGEFDDLTKSAWQQFIKLTSLSAPDAPSSDAINAVRGFNNRVCPLLCAKGQHVEGVSCVVNAPPPAPSRPLQRPQQGTSETVVDMRQQAVGTVVQGGVTTCGPNGCHRVPKNCHAVKLGRSDPEWKGMGGKIVCP